MRFSLFGKHVMNGFGCLATACLMAFTLAGPEVQAQTASSEFMGMRVTVSLDKTEVVVGEPLFLNINVLNENAYFRKGNFGGRLFLSEGNEIDVMVQPPGELPYRYVGGEDAAVYSSVEMDLDNGQSMDTEILLLYDRTKPNGYLFDKPGVYTLRATVRGTILRDPTPFRVELPATRIVVSAPEGPEAEAFKTIGTPAVAKALQMMNTDNAQTVASARQVAEQHPNTVYAPLCRIMSGVAHMRATPPNLDAAAEDFLKFQEFYPDHLRTAEAAFTMVVIYTRAGRTDLARDWLYFVRDAYPSYRLLRHENPFASMYYYAAAEEEDRGRPWWLYSTPWKALAPAAAPSQPAPQNMPSPGTDTE